MIKHITVICVLLGLAANVYAKGFYGKMDVGAGSLLNPDIAETDVRKGGFTAVFQGLLGEDNLKYGAEVGMIEVYTSWDKNRINIKNSLIFVPFMGALQYEFTCGRNVPYIGLSAGPQLAIEDVTNSVPGSSSSSIGSKVYGGGSVCAGLKVPVSKKYDMDISCRYTRVNASENVEMAALYVGLGTKLSFFNASKMDKLTLPFKEKPSLR